MKKKILLLTTVICAFVLCFALTGCGANDKESIEKVINNAVEKSKSATTIDDAPANLLPTGSSSYEGVDITPAINAYFSKFEYSIDEIVVDGSEAKATVTVKAIPRQTLFSLQKEALDNVLGFSGPTNDWTCSFNGQYADLNACVTEYAPLLQNADVESKTATLNLKKFNGDWELDAETGYWTMEKCIFARLMP